MLKIVDFNEFRRGMIGLLKILMFEALESQRLDHYAMYKTMLGIVEEWQRPDYKEQLQDDILNGDEESVARMILNFPRDNNGVENE
jgi:hypothetical protein